MYVKSDTTNAETISSQCLPGAQVILPVEQGAGSGKRRRVEESRADGGDEGDEEEENVATHIIRLFFFHGGDTEIVSFTFSFLPPPLSLFPSQKVSAFNGASSLQTQQKHGQAQRPPPPPGGPRRRRRRRPHRFPGHRRRRPRPARLGGRPAPEGRRPQLRRQRLQAHRHQLPLRGARQVVCGRVQREAPGPARE
jgi:hypothetical protein